MKKILTFVAVTLLATSAFAQITLVQSFDGQVQPLTGYGFLGETSYFCLSNKDNNTITLYDSNFSVHKVVSVTTPSGYVFNGYSAAYYNIFANNKVGFFVVFQNPSYAGTNDYSKSMIIDEDGNVILDLGNSANAQPMFFYMKNTWYMLYWKYEWNEAHTAFSINKTIIYSLPGNGEAAEVNEVSAPRNPARKYLHNDQVLIDSNNRIYNLQGQEVK